MNQRVTARIVGGKRFTTAEYREYFNASRILRDQANRLGTSRRSFIAAGYELKIHPRATPLLSALTGASPRCTAQDHIELPYRQLLGRCEAHAEALQSMASQLNELSSLIAQAQSLYAQAEEASRKGLNIMLRGLFMSSRESAILALTASALMGVRRSYAKEGKFNKFYLVESTAWMQESFVSVLGEHASRLNIQERPSKDTSILEYITKTLFMVTKPGAAIAEGLSVCIRKPKWSEAVQARRTPSPTNGGCPKVLSTANVKAVWNTEPSHAASTAKPMAHMLGGSSFPGPTAITIRLWTGTPISS